MTAPGEAPNDFESIFNNRNVTRVSLSDSDDDVEFPTLRKAAGILKAKLKPRVRLVPRKRRRFPPVPTFDPVMKAEGDGKAADADAELRAEDVGEHGSRAEAVGEEEDAAEAVGDEEDTAKEEDAAEEEEAAKVEESDAAGVSDSDASGVKAEDTEAPAAVVERSSVPPQGQA